MLKKFLTQVPLLIGLFLILMLLPIQANAASYSLTGNVKDNSNNLIQNADVKIFNQGTTNEVVPSVRTDQSGNYTFVSVPQGNYDIQVIPPSGAVVTSSIALSQNIEGDKIVNFILVPNGSVSLSGIVRDANGVALPNQKLNIFPSQGFSPVAVVTTDGDGKYSATITQGSFLVRVDGNDFNGTLNVPQTYNMSGTIALTQSVNTDIIIPAKRIVVRAQDSQGNAIVGARVSIISVNGLVNRGLTLGSGFSTGIANASYTSPAIFTNESGEKVVWLLPTESGSPYRFTVTPPSGSPLTTANLETLITNDGTQTIVLQQPSAVLSGIVRDAAGNPLANQQLNIFPSQGLTPAAVVTTNGTGQYSATLSPGSYLVAVNGNDNNGALNVPQIYSMSGTIIVNQTMTANITIPAKRIVVHVEDSLGTAVIGARVSIISANGLVNRGLTLGSGFSTGIANASYTSPAIFTNESGEKVVWLLPTESGNPYRFTITPPSGSPLSPKNAEVHVSNDGTQNFVLQQPTAVLSGIVRDVSGGTLPNQQLNIFQGFTQVAAVTTNDNGEYSATLPPGSYLVGVNGNDKNGTLNVPQLYSMSGTITFTQNKVANIVIPAKRVQIHVQDSQGVAIPSARINIISANGLVNRSLMLGTEFTTGIANASYTSPAIFTNDSGEKVVWLLPNESGNPYRFTITPAAGTPYSELSLNAVNITGDQTEVISLQYNHDVPITTIDLATLSNSGKYSNPTNVTLSATADTGYTIANTFYKIDGGTQQIYTAPFQVSDEGNHTIEYWSVDNSGLQETHKTKTFTIYVNKAPIVDPLSNALINAGGTYSASGTFSDPDSAAWTATVDYGDGAGPETLPLNSDKTFTLNHQYITPGEYTISVVVRDDQQATGTAVATVTVNGAPEIAGINDKTINLQDTLFVQGLFTDDDSTSWTATVDYGDGSGEQNLPLNGKNFDLDYTYLTAGNFDVIVKVTDNNGAYDIEEFTVLVNAAPAVNSFPGGTLVEGSTYSHTGFFSDPGSTSWTGTVNYGDGTGEQPLVINPDNTFELENIYKDNGFYSIIVSITDNQGANTLQTAFLTVTNDVPNVETITATVNPIQVNTPTSISAPFTDAGVLDAHTVEIDWGDGQVTQCPPNSSGCIVTEGNGSGTINGTHIYQTANVYEIKVTVTDNDTGVGEEYYRYLSVYNPTNQGLFTGVRGFTSQPGSVPGNLGLTGPVQFGVTTKYQGGTPSGNVSMKFNAANIEFESTDINVLVISTTNATGVATLKGKGTLNGAGNYDFLVKGADGGPGGNDYVRFRITDPSNNNAVIYDSQMNASEITAPNSSVNGQVIIHN